MHDVIEAIDDLRRLGVFDVRIRGDKVRMLDDPRNLARAKTLLRVIKPYVMQYGDGSLLDLRRKLQPAAPSDVPVEIREETARFVHLSDPPFPPPSLTTAPAEWLELVDWNYVRHLARNRPVGWQKAIGVHLTMRRLYRWYHAVVDAALEGGR